MLGFLRCLGAAIINKGFKALIGQIPLVNVLVEVGEEAWERWRGHQIMLINEYRLTPVDPKSRKFLETEMEKFFFGTGSSKPGEFVEPARD